MNSDDFYDLLAHLVYLDHDKNTEVVPEITEAINRARAAKLSTDEIVQQVTMHVETLIATGVITAGEQYGQVQLLLKELPIMLATV